MSIQKSERNILSLASSFHSSPWFGFHFYINNHTDAFCQTWMVPLHTETQCRCSAVEAVPQTAYLDQGACRPKPARGSSVHSGACSPIPRLTKGLFLLQTTDRHTSQHTKQDWSQLHSARLVYLTLTYGRKLFPICEPQPWPHIREQLGFLWKTIVANNQKCFLSSELEWFHVKDYMTPTGVMMMKISFDHRNTLF